MPQCSPGSRRLDAITSEDVPDDDLSAVRQRASCLTTSPDQKGHDLCPHQVETRRFYSLSSGIDPMRGCKPRYFVICVDGRCLEGFGTIKWVQIDIDAAARDVDHLVGAEERFELAMARQ